ncbi:MAG: hypothetical protein KGD59_02310 [Candidatus Heimdallarchaeota archaeon]|nr:hypothetical protein [Candidatus Heimdallarchaeota archaeon]MBY8993355.1 hypothetical protein [Candidatus Heimdallarchaeota archaeon]
MNSIIANRINNLVANDPAKIAILHLLADGKWHTRFEVESAARNQRSIIGLVGICVIIKTLQEADSELLEEYDNDSGRFYRLNQQRTVLVRKIVEYHVKNSEQGTTSSAVEFKRFKDRLRSQRKSDQAIDDDLKQFL